MRSAGLELSAPTSGANAVSLSLKLAWTRSKHWPKTTTLVEPGHRSAAKHCFSTLLCLL